MGPDNDKQRKLNVILHGLFAFSQEEEEIVARIPNLGSEHLYKAGSWLAETNLEEHADLTLEGIKPVAPKLDGTEDPESLKFKGKTKVIQGHKLNPKYNIVLGEAVVSQSVTECHCVHATLRLPYPPYPIRSLRRAKIAADMLGGDDKKRLVAGRSELESAAVQILTYEFENENDLKLVDHLWEPVLADGYVNLHVFSEPERAPTDDHVRHAFQACVALFAGVDMVLKGPVRASDPDGPVPGVNEIELQDLIRRQRWLAVLGRTIKQGRYAQLIWDDPIPFGSSDICTGGAAGYGQGGD